MRKDDDRFRKLSSELSALERKSARSFSTDKKTSFVKVCVTALFLIGAVFFGCSAYYFFKRLDINNSLLSESRYAGSFDLFALHIAVTFVSGLSLLFFLKRIAIGFIVLLLSGASPFVYYLTGDGTLYLAKEDRLFLKLAFLIGGALMVISAIAIKKRRNLI